MHTGHSQIDPKPQHQSLRFIGIKHRYDGLPWPLVHHEGQDLLGQARRLHARKVPQQRDADDTRKGLVSFLYWKQASIITQINNNWIF